MWETWVATVRRESSSLAAISGLDMPSSTSLATVVSVGVRLSQPLHLPTPPCHDDARRGVPRRSVEPLRGPHSYLEWHDSSGEPHGRQRGLHSLVIPRSQTRFSETTRFGRSHKA